MTPTTRSRIRGAFLGCALGDGLGMPFETMSSDAIKRRFAHTGVTDFAYPAQQRIIATKGLPPGSTTDDWLLTSAIARSLVEKKGIDLQHLAESQLRAIESSICKAGVTTTQGLYDVLSGVRKLDEPAPYCPGEGGGSGVMMKVAPLGIFFALTDKRHDINLPLYNTVRSLGQMTHGDPTAWVAAFVIASFLRSILLHRYEVSHHFVLFSGTKLVQYNPVGVSGEVVRGLATVLHSYQFLKESSPELVRERFKPLFSALATLQFVFATYLRHCEQKKRVTSNAFMEGVLEAVNAGGDTDTNASLVGTLLGTTFGFEGIPEVWRSAEFFEKYPHFKEAVLLADCFYETFKQPDR